MVVNLSIQQFIYLATKNFSPRFLDVTFDFQLVSLHGLQAGIPTDPFVNIPTTRQKIPGLTHRCLLE